MVGDSALRLVKSVFSTELTTWSDGLSLIADDVVFLSSAGRLYAGTEGMVRWYRDALGEATNSAMVGAGFEPIDEEWVLVRGSVTRHLRGGSEDRQPTTWLTRVREGRLAAVLCYRLEADARASASRLGDTSGAGGLTPSFVMRDLKGRVSANLGGDAGSAPTAEWLRERAFNGVREDFGDGYLLVEGDGPGEGDAAGAPWLVLMRGDELGAAFQFADPARARAALPESVYLPAALELVESAVLAFVSGDATRALPLLAPGFTYTDRLAGLELKGAATVLNGLLLAQQQVQDAGFPGIEFEALAEDVVRVSGLITEPSGPDAGGRWVTHIAADGGRLIWAERQPNERAAG